MSYEDANFQKEFPSTRPEDSPDPGEYSAVTASSEEYFRAQKVEEAVPEPTLEEVVPVEPETLKVVESQFDKVFDPRTPEEIAKEFQDKEEAAAFERAKNQKPEDTASWFFQMIWPRYKERVAKLSNKEARRVLEAIVQWPLIDDRPTFSTEEGKEAFSLGSRLIDAKTIMRDVVELEKLHDMAAKKEEEDNGTKTTEEVLPESSNQTDQTQPES